MIKGRFKPRNGAVHCTTRESCHPRRWLPVFTKSRMFARLAGTGAIVISPTRELSLQTYGVVRDLCKFHMQVNAQTACGKLGPLCAWLFLFVIAI